MLAWMLVFSFILPVNAADLKSAEQKKKQLEEQRKDAESEKASLAAKVNAIVADMKTAEKNMQVKADEIEKAEGELIAAKVEEQTQYDSMKQRIKYMYENGSTDFIEILFEAKNMTDFLNRAEYATKISKYDREMLAKLQKLVKEIQAKEASLKEEYTKFGELQAELSKKQTEAEVLLKEKASELDGINAEMSEVNALISKAKEAERKKREAEEAARREQERQNANYSNSSSGEDVKPPVVSGNGFFTHPCPGMSYQSSYFGEVREGIGDTRPHKGHDYAASPGTPIYAAAAGKVIIAEKNTTAGNWVVINHGNGLVTKYMHMWQKPLVSVGDKVTKGQHIGGVGTTGSSTGNHLHFQVELNGVPVNPSNYM